MGEIGIGGPDMGGLIWYGACNGGPGVVRNVPNPANFTQNDLCATSDKNTYECQ